MPAASAPGLNGSGGRVWYLPWTMRMSRKLQPIARTSIRTSPALGTGGNVSAYSSVAGSPPKLEIARAAGADVVLSYRTEDWVERVQQETGGRGADVIYDPVGGDVFDGSTKCIAFEGRLLPVGFTGGRIAEVATNRVLLKNFSVVGVHWGLYSERDPALVRRWMVGLLKLADAGKLAPVIWKTFPLRDAAAALAAIGARESYGKVLLVP